MRLPARIGYGALAQLARGAAVLVPNGDSKILRAFHARRGIRARYLAWGRAGRDPSRPLLWMHAPSVGEGLQARPVLEAMRASRPDVQLAYTHYSPSAVDLAHSLDVDFRDYLPFDTTGDAHAILDALQPTALVFSKLDVWPVLTREASARGVRLGMISATLSDGSSRRSGVASSLLRDAYAALDAVGAVDASDAERLVQLGVRSQAIVVTGDTRYDQVWRRAQPTARVNSMIEQLRIARLTIVAGSTWQSDEAVLLPAFASLRRSGVDARMIIAPHEPTVDHVSRLADWSMAAGFTTARLGGGDQVRADVIVVDGVGVLGDLYALADIAFVGGAFHSAGLHSVIEPAAFGAPVLFGPQHESSRDASLLEQCGGGVSVSSVADLTACLRLWAADTAARSEAAHAARAFVERGIGAATRSLDLVCRLMD